MESLKDMKLLYVEDNDDTREFSVMFLEEYFEHIVTAKSGLDGLQKFKECDIDIVITDINMPEMTGLEMAKEIKNIDENVVILALSAYSNKEYLVDSIKVGIDDYVFKPLDANEFDKTLKSVIQKYNSRKNKEESLIKMEQEIQKHKEILKQKDKLIAQKSKMAYYDQLTTLCNRYCFYAKYDEIIKCNSIIGIVLIDIDNFKKINDIYGHDVGDLVLKGFADIIKDNIRDVDLACRWGGEEFALLLNLKDIDEVYKATERIREAVNSVEFPCVGEVTASFGVTLCVDNESLELAMKRCDEALYHAKYNGKNRVYIG